MMENALSILIIFSVQLQQIEISERKLFIFQYRLRAACVPYMDNFPMEMDSDVKKMSGGNYP